MEDKPLYHQTKSTQSSWLIYLILISVFLMVSSIVIYFLIKIYNTYYTDSSDAQIQTLDASIVDIENKSINQNNNIQIQDPVKAMRERYFPGPFITIVDMIPSNKNINNNDIISIQKDRTGRTINTPWTVRDSKLEPQSAASSSLDTKRPVINFEKNSVDSLTIVPGALNTIKVETTDPDGFEDIKGLNVAFENYPGHFFVPVYINSELFRMEAAGMEESSINFSIDSPVRADGIIATEPFTVKMYIAAVDRADNVSEYITKLLTIMPVGKGDVEVILTMSKSTDLDLYVVDPANITIYYNHRNSLSGGQLDLDANAACSGNMGINNEHIFWPAGIAPAGTYTVRVANYESCINGEEVQYTVTVKNCGEIVVLSGSFKGNGDQRECNSPPGGDSKWCQDVVNFVVSPCI